MIGYDQGINPYTGQRVGVPVAHTPADELDRVATAAQLAAPMVARQTLSARSALLRRIAAHLEQHREELVALADAETGLGAIRLGGELTRATLQWQMFADVVAEGSFLEVVIDRAEPGAVPTPRPDLRRILVPMGPVAVFAASNFPFAFSVVGGDTASALAAGCPVIIKAHPGHPGLSARCAEILVEAIATANAPVGSVAVVYGLDAGRALVTHPAVTAVGFTGSLVAGRALFDLACSRPDPIPFYGELGSLNPSVVSSGAIAARGPEIAQGFVTSFTLSSGQFCTKPGLLFLPTGHGLAEVLGAQVAAVQLGPLLNASIRDRYVAGVQTMAELPGVRSLVPPPVQSTMEFGDYGVSPMLWAVSAAELIEQGGALLEECFGPAAIVVEYNSPDELHAALAMMPGSLTMTLHADEGTESELVAMVLALAEAKAGRVIWNGWPTGVAVTWAQHHGGPWPATTASAHTSVGVTAVRRFLRPVAYQNLPDGLLPAALRDANPLGLPRRVNGLAVA